MTKGPSTLGSVLGGTVDQLARRARMAVRPDVWRAAVGHRVADRTQPGRLGRGVLEVRVASPVWAQELTYLAPTITDRLRASGVDVHELRFRVGNIEPGLPVEPARERARRAPLPPELEQRLEQIEDDELRAAIADAAALHFGAKRTSE